jgi:hypothetical protein
LIYACFHRDLIGALGNLMQAAHRIVYYYTPYAIAKINN